MLQKDPKKRPTAIQVIENDWFKQIKELSSEKSIMKVDLESPRNKSSMINIAKNMQ